MLSPNWEAENEVQPRQDPVPEGGDRNVQKGKVATLLENRKNRVLGRKYVGTKKMGIFSVPYEKTERKLNPKVCSHGDFAKSCRSFVCGAFDEEYRKKLFKKFWGLPTWEEKQSLLSGLVNFGAPIKRRRGKDLENGPALKKNHGYDCFLMSGDNKVRVCREFFLGTFDLKHDAFHSWIRRIHSAKVTDSRAAPSATSTVSTENDSLKRSNRDSAVQWLEQLPKVPSHYCRKGSTGIYVEPTFDSMVHMHKVYSSYCEEKGVGAVGRKCFQSVMTQQKMSIFKPRKDICDICSGFKEGNVPLQVYNEHIEKKTEADQAKLNAKELAGANEKVLVVTMDLQVLLSPKLEVSSQYYKQKLLLHNFSIHELRSRDVHVYVWHEGEGNITANEFVSCILHYLTEVVTPASYEKVIFISDGCTYQNRNETLTSALDDYSKDSGIEIEQLYLETGHTMMEVDSVHSTLERLFKPPLYTPMDYVTKMGQARPRQPYKVSYLDHSFFKNYESQLHNFQSICPVEETEDSDVRAFLYKNGEVFYKTRHPEEWKALPCHRTCHNKDSPEDLYFDRIPIEQSKFRHLQELKVYMHRDYQEFYDSLCFKN